MSALGFNSQHREFAADQPQINRQSQCSTAEALYTHSRCSLHSVAITPEHLQPVESGEILKYPLRQRCQIIETQGPWQAEHGQKEKSDVTPRSFFLTDSKGMVGYARRHALSSGSFPGS